MKDDRNAIILSSTVFLCFSVLSIYIYIKDSDKVTMRPDKKLCSQEKKKYTCYKQFRISLMKVHIVLP